MENNHNVIDFIFIWKKYVVPIGHDFHFFLVMEKSWKILFEKVSLCINQRVSV